jgi:hypothetical protein
MWMSENLEGVHADYFSYPDVADPLAEGNCVFVVCCVIMAV